MELTWLESLIYGFISGLTEFLPVSAEGHRALFLNLIGAQENPVMRLAVHAGALSALFFFCAPILSRLRRERRIASIPKKHRKRQPDLKSLLDFRIWRTAMIPLILVLMVYPLVSNLHERLWFLAVFFGISGIILYVPQYMPGSNKDSQSLSSLDAVLIGVSTGLGAVPGISRMGSSLSVSLMRGVERRYALDLGLLLGVPALIVLIVFDVWWLLTGTAATVTGMVILCSVTAAVASFVSSYLGMFIMRFLSVKIGFSGFAYYCWGVALFTLIIYLMIS